MELVSKQNDGVIVSARDTYHFLASQSFFAKILLDEISATLFTYGVRDATDSNALSTGTVGTRKIAVRGRFRENIEIFPLFQVPDCGVRSRYRRSLSQTKRLFRGGGTISTMVRDSSLPLSF